MTEIPPKLRWACRRGMLELDVLLGNFLQDAYPLLTADDQLLFEQFLSNTDQDLFVWLTGRIAAPAGPNFDMVAKVRQHAHNRHSV